VQLLWDIFDRGENIKKNPSSMYEVYQFFFCFYDFSIIFWNCFECVVFLFFILLCRYFCMTLDILNFDLFFILLCRYFCIILDILNFDLFFILLCRYFCMILDILNFDLFFILLCRYFCMTLDTLNFDLFFFNHFIMP
jgi:hypothetical protein